jgi:hypothetical protein
MLTIREVIKTLYNALLQRLKKHRGNWDQNDPTSDDYIKNRPFYTDETNKETVVKTKTFTATNPYWWGSPFAFIPVVGETYKVTWDGKEYICIGKIAVWGGKYIGNISIDDDGPDTGEPFWYYWYDSSDYGMCVRDQGKHTIAIEKIKIVKIDKKYLPDDINIDLAPVAKSGNYWDLEDLPEIPNDPVRHGIIQDLTRTHRDNARINIRAVGYDNGQNLTESEKIQARTNIGAVGYEVQSLTNAQKQQARTNIGAVSSSEVTGVVKYTAQELTEEQKAQARANIGTLDADYIENQIEKAKDYVALIDQVNGDTYLVSMQDGELVSDIGVQDIKIVQMPNKTSYMRGEYFDPTGMIVTATCQDGSVKELKNYAYTKDYFAMGTTSIDIVYKEAGIVHKDTVQVTVSEFDPATVLVDFTYTDNGDGTYTITDWKGTLNGTPSTEIIIPNYGCIIV